ncbi:MAG: S-layer homology domain-containing protein [Oscillospiraceae bacterium]|nr:S-layer homology domain-containing protein [Oscillospiraceae bacterium]
MKKFLSFLLCLTMLLGCIVPISAAGKTKTDLPDDLQAIAEQTAAYLLTQMPQPLTGGAGDHVMFLLARGGYAVPTQVVSDYYLSVGELVLSQKGVLSERQYSDYARVSMTLRAIGKDPSDVAGYDLLTPLGDFENTVRTGLSGAVNAMRALDSGNYDVPICESAETQATRELYLNEILNAQLEDGGWTFFGDAADADMTSMVLSVLARYRDRSAVKNAVQLGIDCLSKMQNDDGSFSSWGSACSESCAQVLVAMDALGLKLDDARLVKNGKTVLDALLSYYIPGSGFCHTDTLDMTASYQALEALTALLRTENGKSALYDLRDITPAETETAPAVQPSAWEKDVTFSDIADHSSKTAIEALASRGIINGIGGSKFAPDDTMTRAQFAAIVVRSLNLEPAFRGTFTDVEENAWYAAYIDTAAAYGIVNGVGAGRFSPEGLISRQDAAVMLVRAAKLCGMDTQADASDAARYKDHSKIGAYALDAVGICRRLAILKNTEKLEPQLPVVRAEIAQMLCDLLLHADLLK